MNYFFTILLVNSFMVSCLHGMGMDTSEDGSPEAQILLDRLGKCTTPWEADKAAITALMTTHNMHPDAIKYGFNNGKVPLYDAVSNSDEEFMQFLLDHKADANVRVYVSGSHNNDPVLFCAPSTTVAQLLIDRKADVNARGGCSRTLPLLCCHTLRFSGTDPDLITFYGQHGVDVRAVNEHGESPLHELVNSWDKPIARTKEQAQKFIEIGVPLDTQSRGGSLSWAYMTAIQWLIVRIKQDSRGEIVKEHNVQLLLVLKQALKAKVSTELRSVLTKDPTGIVLDYYDNGQTDAEINGLVAQIAIREGYIARKGQEEILALQNGSGGSW